VLKAMNRQHTAESYLRLLEQFRAVRPDIALSGDFIVGFPGETEAEFEDTLRIVDEVRYAHAFSFKYSPRPGTPAATMEGQIAPEVMDERLQRLQARIAHHQFAFNQASVGKTCSVLVERTGRSPGQWLGKSPWLQPLRYSPALALPPRVLTFATQDEGLSLGLNQRNLWADDPPVPDIRLFRPIRAIFRNPGARALI